MSKIDFAPAKSLIYYDSVLASVSFELQRNTEMNDLTKSITLPSFFLVLIFKQ